MTGSEIAQKMDDFVNVKQTLKKSQQSMSYCEKLWDNNNESISPSHELIVRFF